MLLWMTLLFHLLLAPVCLWVVSRWRRRLDTPPGPAAWLKAAAGDLLLVCASTIVLAAAAALFAPSPGFTLLRFLSQALFGEGLLLLAAVAALHARRGLGRAALALGLLAGALVACYAEAYHREPGDLKVRVYDVDLSHGAPRPHRLRIVQMSDLQANRIGEHEDRAVQTALAQKPDLIVLTGDYVQPRTGLAPSREKTTADLKELLRRRGFKAPLGVYAVEGDVDRAWPFVIAGTGITPLSGTTERVPLPEGRALCLVGLTPGMSRGTDARGLLALARSASRDDLRIVIGHNPNFIQGLADASVPVDLALAGHTHGGQVVLPLLGPPITQMSLPRRYASGLHDYRGIPLHVSAGIGMERGTAPQIRFLCPPEISVIDVRY
jgi:predicted MPP superfamily phosphohydrolase